MKSNRRAIVVDKIETFLFYLTAGIIITLLASVTIYLVFKGFKSSIPKYMSFGIDGLGIQFFNTLYMVFLSIIISDPLGVCAGIYMA